MSSIRLSFFGNVIKTLNIFSPLSSMFYITPLNDGKWHHLCLTLQASSGRQELFLDGESGISGNEVVNVSRNISSGGRLVLGQRILSSGQVFHRLSSFEGKLLKTFALDTMATGF